MPVGTTIAKFVASETAWSMSARRPTPTVEHSTRAVKPCALMRSISRRHQRDDFGSIGLRIAGHVPCAQIDKDVLVRQDRPSSSAFRGPSVVISCATASPPR